MLVSHLEKEIKCLKKFKQVIAYKGGTNSQEQSEMVKA